MDLGISGRNALVCASSKGLGRACAVELARAGCRVAINGRDAALLARLDETERFLAGSQSLPGDLQLHIQLEQIEVSGGDVAHDRRHHGSAVFFSGQQIGAMSAIETRFPGPFSDIVTPSRKYRAMSSPADFAAWRATPRDRMMSQLHPNEILSGDRIGKGLTAVTAAGGPVS